MSTSDEPYLIRRGAQVNELQAQYVIDCPDENCAYTQTGTFRRQADASRELSALIDEHVRTEHRGWS